MIYYFVTTKHRYTIDTYLQSWGSRFEAEFRVVPYEAAQGLSFEGVKSVIFSDFDRLSPQQARAFGTLCDTLRARSDLRVLNHPRDSASRYQLLSTLFAEKLNSFRAYRLDDCANVKFPAFLRHATEHAGASHLLHSQQELAALLPGVLKAGVNERDLLLVEFCDTVDASGIYRKYSAFAVGRDIVPRHVIFSRNWLLKWPDLLTAEFLAEERRYLEDNPHRAELARVFELAAIDYGRIDYAVLNGKLCVWEINSNPYVMQLPKKYPAEHLPNQEWFAPRIQRSFELLLA